MQEHDLIYKVISFRNLSNEPLYDLLKEVTDYVEKHTDIESLVEKVTIDFVETDGIQEREALLYVSVGKEFGGVRIKELMGW